jgi:mannose-6-phosphate isomerase-like protein (cupin superfamily)
MSLPVGQRQKGLHYHSITEIYVILKGELEGYDHTGTPHRAGKYDCMYIPAGVPHGVRNCGDEDCELVWVHDGIEKVGTSQYFMDGIIPADYPPQPDISIVRFASLEPSYSPFKAKEVEWMRWCVSWVAGKKEDGYENYNPGVAVENTKVGMGMTVLMPGQKSVPYSQSGAETYVVMRGKAVIQLAESQGGRGNWRDEIGKLDGVYVPGCAVRGVRNFGDEPLFLMWVQERPEKVADIKYVGA